MLLAGGHPMTTHPGDQGERTSAEELLRTADRIAIAVRERAPQTERERRVSADIVQLMREGGLFRVLQPRQFGGFEYGFDLFAEIAAKIAAGCPSSGWVGAIGMVHQWFIALFPEQAQRDVWESNPGAIAYGSYAPSGTARPCVGGQLVSGRWPFASGCDNAQWLLLGGKTAAADGALSSVFFLVDATDCTIEDDWHTMGLEGTGSKTIVLNDVLIPHHRTVSVAELVSGSAPGTKVHNNSLYRVPLLAVLPLCLAAPALGMAQGAFDTFMETTKTRVTRGAVAGGNLRVADFPTVQVRIAEAAGSIDAGRLLLMRDIAETFASVVKDEPVTIDTRIHNRLDHAFATKLFIQAVDVLFQASGGSAVYSSSALQRFWRDIHAAGVHVSLSWDSVAIMYGRHALGLEPTGQY
jgi:alkylation response protein AidB-like acyl-CoA dehydrogenase